MGKDRKARKARKPQAEASRKQRDRFRMRSPFFSERLLRALPQASVERLLEAERGFVQPKPRAKLARREPTLSCASSAADAEEAEVAADAGAPEVFWWLRSPGCMSGCGRWGGRRPRGAVRRDLRQAWRLREGAEAGSGCPGGDVSSEEDFDVGHEPVAAFGDESGCSSGSRSRVGRREAPSGAQRRFG